MPHLDHYHNGQRLTSVTELQGLISKPFLDRWRKGLCQCKACKPGGDGECGFVKGDKVAKEAAELGNLVHEEVAGFLSSANTPVCHPWAVSIVEELTGMNIRQYLIEPETNLIDNESGLAGSPDFVAQFFNTDVKFIGDLKLKNQLDSLTALQGVGYRYLIRRLYKVDLNKMLVVWGKKKSKNFLVEPVWIDLDPWQKTWESLVEIWNKVNSKRKVILHD